MSFSKHGTVKWLTTCLCDKSIYKNDSYVAAQRSFRLHFNLKRHDSVLSVKAIKIWITNFKEMGSALKKKPV